MVSGFDWHMIFKWEKNTGGANLNGVIRFVYLLLTGLYFFLV